ncbi:hypothetical protein AQUCO_02600072v1 [Aquilegia coerulea]|uniref:J domain-containing protein n=1 Tax=Aquilegia coerulea TaxID=218851 RepID=A0A2G5D775_AQUCA|nr:hypothetical protein AQUCO_02600072v1 [Aquilegia coerulea]PIA39360.1 hypothetical protein AQUCO_02600072v1 [Aquilegia coerulea]PIA39361.1 hypothetical protein AQUCO_02600072v1 [Aquilegia coerulea]
MGSKKRSSKKKYLTETDDSSSSLYSSSDSETSLERKSRRRRSRDDKYKKSSKSSRSEKKEKHERRDKRKEKRKSKEDRHRSRRKKRDIDEGDSSLSDDEKPEIARSDNNPEAIFSSILKRFPDVVLDLKQLLQMIDDGQAVDTRGISDRSFVKQLRKLFLSLNLKESDVGIYLLPPEVRPTLEVIGPMISLYERPREQKLSHSDSPSHAQSIPSNEERKQTINENDGSHCVKDDSAPRRRVIGPEMPSSELLAAAAKLTEAEAELRQAEFEMDDDLFIGPPPPAVAAEAASANEAERFEEVTKIMEAEIGSPYDVLGVNRNMPADNIKKRYWKLSLMVHPDKCSHPQAHQAFVILNKAFKELQDPDKRKAMDDKIQLKEEQEAFKAELKQMREAAQWRRLQGISMEGDDELLAETKLPQKREEWMTTLPPERKAGGVSMHSTTAFSRTTKEGRGDTSAWTDTPEDKTQKAKMNYLEAYNEAAALASNEEKKRTNSDADLVDQYNRTKRSKSLVEKHQEDLTKRPKKKSKQEKKKEEWAGQHPWKPWDREKDLTAGRQNVNLDADNMVKGLTSRFSGGNIQRNFL